LTISLSLIDNALVVVRGGSPQGELSLPLPPS
jgi:hypothetical protein